MMRESSTLNTRTTLLVAFITGVLFIAGSTCFAQDDPTTLPGSDYRSTVRFGENDVTVPSRFGTHVLISVDVNGSPRELALDTGASYSPMAAPIAEQWGLKRVRGIYVGCRVREYVQVNIKVGKIIIENQRFCASRPRGWDAKVEGSTYNVPALLGYDFLRNFVVEVDYVHRVVVLHNPETFKFHPDETYVGEMPFRLVKGTPHIDVAGVFGNESRRQIDALVDTGSWRALEPTHSTFAIINKLVPYRWEFGQEWILNIPGYTEFEPSDLSGPVNFEAVLGNRRWRGTGSSSITHTTD